MSKPNTHFRIAQPCLREILRCTIARNAQLVLPINATCHKELARQNQAQGTTTFSTPARDMTTRDRPAPIATSQRTSAATAACSCSRFQNMSTASHLA
jgi:hypothetical protein